MGRRVVIFFPLILLSFCTAYSRVDLNVPNSTILFIKQEHIYKEGESGESKIESENIWYVSDKTDWEPKQLTYTKDRKSEPRLSTDGSKVLWFSRKDSYTYELDLLSGKVSKLFKGFFARYSPSGESIAFVSQKAVASIGIRRLVEIYNRESKEIRTINEETSLFDKCHSLNWLGDSKISFITDYSSGKPRIEVFDLKGKKLREIEMPLNARINNIELSPDYTKWLFQSSFPNDDSFSRIYTMDFHGENIKKIFEDGSRTYYVSPSWSPDGKFVVFAATFEGSGRLIIIELESGAHYNFPRGAYGLMPYWGNKMVSP